MLFRSIVDARGPDHAKLFRIEVLVDEGVIGVGEGYSRRVAETEAAAAALATMLAPESGPER